MFFRIVTGMTRPQKRAAFISLDALVILFAFGMSVLLTAHGRIGMAEAAPVALVLVTSGAILGWVLGLTRMKLDAFEMRGPGRTAAYAAALGLLGYAIAPRALPALPVGAHVHFTLLVLVLSVGWRIALRYAIRQIYLHGADSVRVLIYGAGATGQQLVAALRHHDAIRPVAFIDDNPTLQSQVIAGLRVHAASSIPKLVAEKRISRVVLAMPSMSQPAMARIRLQLRNIGCEAHALPSFAALVGEGALRAEAEPVCIQKLLGRNRLEKELPGVIDAYAGRRILISGAGGSIGAELCRQLAACGPECVVLVDHSELALYTIHKELSDLAPEVTVVPLLQSVLNERAMLRAMLTHRVDVVLHAAAYKHLPLVEDNVIAGLENNVLGTKALADAARQAGVDRFILVSSDKAVRPTNVMGASKRLAELVVQDLASRRSGTRFAMVRFGNVLGSSGSVIPLFEEQIGRGGPVTLTDPNVTRYFMTISEAARLVLLTGSFARGGDVFVLDMGAPVPIRKIAEQMIEGAGYTVRTDDTPEGDIEIRVTGLRRGEKLHEELLISSDMLTTPHPKILRAQEMCLSEFEVANALRDLRQAIDALDEDAARAVIAKWVESSDAGRVAKQSV
ncbi:nucleoside-diphosphate sugar epimerase/dehydratase [Sagittula sp. MA-2]|jgi:FlaA1/EpsC-like NDP-sugar epimerase|uniref:polysaccharide biosynthesis protein n=1 Tax=Sagittula sp. MA-2 TaxID=3048007 RepID=UPI0024C2C2FD|nr:nucleoside-diphosphate sugar epimerase/dehydratase [Sagittula sp. MA-2]WHZ34920.1 nucleoside-diphosphate sugar epimerase/dehydratase [Sagittula sp. MA-2]